jgi:hypothetical protein
LSSDKNVPTYLNETSRTASNETQLYNGDFIAPSEAKTGLLYVQYLANTSNVAIGGNLTIIIELVKGVAGSPTVQRDTTQALPYCTLNITYEVVAPPPPPGSPPPPAATGNIQGSPLANTPQFTPTPGIPRTNGVDDGKGNRGYANQGSLNIGNDNIGNCNQGDGNTGNNNIGSGNKGDCNQGYGNIGNGLVGNGLKGSGPNVGCACQVTASGGK